MPYFKTPLSTSPHWLDDIDDPSMWLPDGSVRITDEEAEALRPVPPPPPISPISPRQIRQALTRAGLRASVEAAVASGDQDLKDWYEFSTAFDRQNPQVTAMGVALDVSPTSLDELWALGATL